MISKLKLIWKKVDLLLPKGRMTIKITSLNPGRCKERISKHKTKLNLNLKMKIGQNSRQKQVHQFIRMTENNSMSGVMMSGKRSGKI